MVERAGQQEGRQAGLAFNQLSAPLNNSYHSIEKAPKLAYLVDHDTSVGHGVALALGARAQQESAHGGSQAKAVGLHVGAAHHHGVIDAHARSHAAAGGVDEQLDVLVGEEGWVVVVCSEAVVGGSGWVREMRAWAQLRCFGRPKPAARHTLMPRLAVRSQPPAQRPNSQPARCPPPLPRRPPPLHPPACTLVGSCASSSSSWLMMASALKSLTCTTHEEKHMIRT